MSEPLSGRRRPPRRRTVLASAAAGLGTALTGTLSACSTASGGTSRGVTLTFSWWGNDDRAARTKRAVQLFEKEHPGVTVQTSNADFGSYMQKLATQAAGGGIPDVAQLDYRQISQYAGGGALLRLGDAIGDGTVRTSAPPACPSSRLRPRSPPRPRPSAPPRAAAHRPGPVRTSTICARTCRRARWPPGWSRRCSRWSC